MYLPDISGGQYATDPARFRRLPQFFKKSFWFYLRYVILVIWSGIKFHFTRDPQKAVTLQALRVMRMLEKQGASLNFSGLDQYPPGSGPFVFACNHMSTLEVNALPGLVASRIPMTFIVKKGLLRTPFFGKVLRRLRAIPVTRENPGEDLMQVLTEGEERLKNGMSVILFPDGTRQETFDPGRFNSLAVKLAIRAKVPVIPVALRTDFWGTGRKIKEFGSLHRDLPVHISFGSPLMPRGRGKNEHAQVLEYITQKLTEWGSPVSSKSEEMR